MKKRVVLVAMLLIVTILPATCAGSAHGLQWFPITPAPAAPATPSHVSFPTVSITPAYPVTTFPKPVSPKPAMSFWYTGSLGSRNIFEEFFINRFAISFAQNHKIYAVFFCLF